MMNPDHCDGGLFGGVCVCFLIFGFTSGYCVKTLKKKMSHSRYPAGRPMRRVVPVRLSLLQTQSVTFKDMSKHSPYVYTRAWEPDITVNICSFFSSSLFFSSLREGGGAVGGDEQRCTASKQIAALT